MWLLSAELELPIRVFMRVLLVEDHPITRDALTALLRQHDFTVVGAAADGAEAVELARRLRPQLVLLDLSMPGVGGLEALPRIRDAAPECEVVVLLHISEHTVRSHVKSLLRKLGVSSRREALEALNAARAA